MKKKEYMKPAMRVVKMQHHGIICTSGGVRSLGSNLEDGDDFIFGSGGSEQGR